jgi:hypothetical protein
MDATALLVVNASTDAIARISDGFVGAMETIDGTFAQREAAALALANELVRRWIEHELSTIENGLSRELVVDGRHYRRHEPGEITYDSLCGPVRVTRCTYRAIGVHNGPTIAPVELAAGIIAGTTPALANSVTQGYAAMPLRDYEAEMCAAHRRLPSRTKLERAAKVCATAIKRALPVIEPLVRVEEELPEFSTISLGLDRVATPMAEQRDEALPRRRDYVRTPPPPVEVVYRMSYVGTVALHDRDGAVVGTRRFAASAAEGPRDVVRRMFAEVEHLRIQQRDAHIVVVQDGAPELWKLVDRECLRRGLKPDVRLIDWFHVHEHLAAALEILCVDAYAAHRLHERWRASLARSDTAIDRITKTLAALDCVLGIGSAELRLPRRWRGIIKHELSSDEQRALSTHVMYFVRHKARMRYASARRRGFPIGSGVTEGACKSVVTARCKRSGQRWSPSGLATCLVVRTLLLSGRLQPCFARMHASYARELRAA